MNHAFRSLLLIGLLGPVAAARAQPGVREPISDPSSSLSTTPGGSPQYRAKIPGEVAVGEMAPDFELPGSAGKQVKLSSYRGHWLVLAFGDRKETVSPLREVCAQLDSSGIHLLGVCAEKTYFLSSFVNRESFPFTILADDTREISDLYGLYESRERKVLPGYILINPRGEIRLSMLGQTLPPGDVARVVKYVSTQL